MLPLLKATFYQHVYSGQIGLDRTQGLGFLIKHEPGFKKRRMFLSG